MLLLLLLLSGFLCAVHLALLKFMFNFRFGPVSFEFPAPVPMCVCVCVYLSVYSAEYI